MLIQTRLFHVYLLKLSTFMCVRFYTEQTDVIVLLTGACKQAQLISAYTKQAPIYMIFN